MRSAAAAPRCHTESAIPGSDRQPADPPSARPSQPAVSAAGCWCALTVVLLVSLSSPLSAQTTTRVSVGPGGVERFGSEGLRQIFGTWPTISADGRYVAYAREIGGVVPDDSNGLSDVFVHDRLTGQTTRVSVATGGGEGNLGSTESAISADGRYVAFASDATNLVAGDSNGQQDVFVRDRQTGQTTRVSVATGGAQANGPSDSSAISADGRYVAFASYATNLVTGDSNGRRDVFVHDRQTGQTTRVSVATGGAQANDPSGASAMSADGRYVAFVSDASNLVADDTNGASDIFLHDVWTGQTRRVSVAANGTEADSGSYEPDVSVTGRYVAFSSSASNLVPDDTNRSPDIFVHDVWTSQTTRVSVATGGAPANDRSEQPTITGDGRYVAFTSWASNLVAGDTNGQPDVFVHDRLTGQTERVSVDSFGRQVMDWSGNAAMSADGTCVVFDSAAAHLVPGDTNGLVEPFVHDRTAGTVWRVMLKPDGTQVLYPGGTVGSAATISGDGRHVAFRRPFPRLAALGDIFVHAREFLETRLVSTFGAGTPALTDDGRYVAFPFIFDYLVPDDTNGQQDIFVRDWQTGQTTRVSVATGGAQANGPSDSSAISADGRYVAFASYATNLVTGDSNGRRDVFVHDRQTGQTTRVSVATGGAQANDPSGASAMSADGRYVAFVSDASNLVADDTNGASDIFLHDVWTGQTRRVSVAANGTEADSGSYEPDVSVTGRYVAFSSSASNLVPDDTNRSPDIFVHDVWTSQTTRVSVATGGAPANDRSEQPTITGDGRYVAFTSWASNLVAGDTNGQPDVFVHDRLTGETRRVSVATGGGEGNGGSTQAAISADGQHVAFTSEASNLVPNDTNGASDVFVASADTDQDGLPYDWEVQFGLDPTDATGVNGPLGDPDGDGRTNAQELAEQTHPTNVAALSRYLAEGATSRFFDTQLALFNPTATPARALVRYLNADGTVTARYRYVPGYTRVTLNPKDVLHLPVAEFSTQLETDGLLVLDRTMRWDTTTFYGSHAETAMLAPAPQWYFAEGATHSGFSLFYLLQNPHATDTTVTLTYLRPGGLPPLEKPYTVAANSRRTIWVNHEAATDPALADLAATDLSVVVTADDPALPVVAERAMYLDTDGLVFGAGHESAGVTAPALNWFLAEGATGDYFDLFVLLANPSATPAEVQVTYLLPSGATVVRPHTVPANARVTLWVDHEDAALADTAVSTAVAVTNGVPILAERAMWWPGPTWATWAEAHNSPGSPVTGPTWALAEGEVSQDWHIVTYLLIANTSPTVGEARVTLYLEDGTTRTRTFALAANSRFNVDVAAEFPDVVNQRFGAIVESLGPTPDDLVVERAMYSDAPGLVWAAGTNALGTRVP